MKTTKDSIFQLLDPPAGGAQAVAQRITASTGELPWFWRPSAAIAVVVVLSIVVLYFRVSDPNSDVVSDVTLNLAPDFNRLLGRPIEPLVTQISLNGKVVPVVQLQTSASAVRVYQLN